MALAKPVKLDDTDDSPEHITEILHPGGMVRKKYTEPYVEFSCERCGAKGGDTLAGTLQDAARPGLIIGGYQQLWQFRTAHKECKG